MTGIQIVDALKAHKGQHVPAIWQRTAKVFADCPLVIVKRTTAYVRAGIDYSNLALVREGIENGTRGPVQSLKWGTWAQFPFIIAHKAKEYVRLYPAVFANLTPTVEWFIDGRPATYADVEPYLLASEKRDSEEEVTCFTVCADNVLSIGMA